MATDSPNRMIGAVIGDVVGSTFEFADKIPTRYKQFRSACSFTDDTEDIANDTNAYLPKEFRGIIEQL